jgi:zinc/manganese transport system substrate-binding protein
MKPVRGKGVRSVGAPARRDRNPTKLTVLGITVGLLAAGCASSAAPRTSHSGGVVIAIGAESQYANVIAQIGGRYVDATAIMSNPNTDPHTFEASPSVAENVSAARLVVQNGAGYDSFMDNIEAGSPDGKRKVLDVQKLLGLPDHPKNPHLWYNPATMPAVARAVAGDLSALVPAHKAYFSENLARFDRSLTPWYQAIAHFKADYHHVAVATTEPVADYMLQAAGTDDETPFALQADIMNGVDPAPQDITLQDDLLNSHKIKVFVYNEQVTDSITQSFLDLAKRDGVPVVGVYETMPTPGYDYQTWMLAEVEALQKAVADRDSTGRL